MRSTFTGAVSGHDGNDGSLSGVRRWQWSLFKSARQTGEKECREPNVVDGGFELWRR
jgi:hypothetical protein